MTKLREMPDGHADAILEDFVREIQNEVSLPDTTVEALARYVVLGLQPGGFLTAVLSNDLTQAVLRADDNNKAVLPELVSYIWMNLPAQCWGSPKAVLLWEGLEVSA